MNTRLQIIGGGNMGEALLGGLAATGWASNETLHVVELDADRRQVLATAHPGLSVGSEPLTGVDALIAVKPHIVPAVCATLASAEVSRALSIAAGVTLATLEAGLAPGTAVVRAMPNTPSLVGLGAAAIAAGTKASNDDLNWATSILSSVGTVVVVDEIDLDAVTGLSGSGPAYVFLLAEALMAAAQAEGLTAPIAKELTQQTLLGAATLLATSEDNAATLRQNVTSKGGTTAAGLAVFEEAGFGELIQQVVSAAAQRARELGAT
ncbi:MAG: pyrroline-5-carboxylate reductase [Actinobacteria bacterium]|nr:pyrroline-5-carboxylate reductase [Actinomycetota bacterium]